MSVFCLLMYLVPISAEAEPSPEVQKQIDDIINRLLNATTTNEPPKEMPYYFNKA